MFSYKSLRPAGHRRDSLRHGPLHRSFVALIALVLMTGIVLVPGAANAAPTPLEITTTASSDPVASGTSLTYTINVVNQEPDTVSVRLTDQINGLRDLVLTTSRGHCFESDQLVTCEGGELPGHGASWLVTIRGIVTAPNGDTLTNTATVVARKGGQDFSEQSTSSVLVSNQPTGPLPDLSVSIDAPLSANPSSSVPYTLTVNNSGGTNATDIDVTAHLPAGYSIDSVAETSLFDCVAVAPAVECTGGAVNAGSNAVIIINATTAASPGSYMTKAVADPYDSILESDELNNTASREMNLPAPPPPTEPFEVTKTGPAQIRLGDLLTYEINITNTAPKWRADRVKITDGTQGLDMRDISVTSNHPRAICAKDEAASTIFCDAANHNLVLAPGQSMLVTITGRVVAEPSTVLRNTVTVQALQNKVSITRTSSVSTTVRPKVDLTVTQAAVCTPLDAPGAPTNPWGSCPFRARDQFNYVITVGNSGLDDAENVRVREPLPADVVFEGYSAQGGFNCTASALVGGVVDCKNGTVPGEVSSGQLGGTIRKIVLHLTAPNSVGPITATTTVDPANAIFEADETNNTFTTTTPIATGIDLTVMNQVNFDPVAPSGTLVYSIIMQNVGTQDASAIKMSDILPAGTRFRSAREVPNPAHFPYTPVHGFSCSHDGAETGGQVDCTGGALKGTYAFNGGPAWQPLALQDTVTIEITLFSPAPPGLILNQALVDPNGNIAEIIETNNLNIFLTDVQIPVVPGTNGTYHEFSLTNEQTSPAGDVAPNGTLIYTLTLKNWGSDPAFNISVYDTIPQGSRFRSAESSPLSGGNGGFICTFNAGVVQCGSGALAPGGTATIQIKLFAPDTPTDATSNYTNHAVVDPFNAIPEADETNNVADVATVVAVGGGNVYNDFTISNAQAVPVGGGAVAPSGTLIYRLTVANTGSDLAQNVVVRDYLPEGTIFRSARENTTLSSTGSGGFTCFHDDSIGVVECRNGKLLAGGQAVIDITMFAPTQPGTINNQAAVDPDNALPEGNEGNNTAVSPDTSVALGGAEAYHELRISELTGAPTSVATDTPVTYTLEVTNDGSDQAFNIELVDHLAQGMTFVSASDDSPGPGAFTCSEVTRTVTCTGGSIPGGGSRTLTIIARSPSFSDITLVNNAVTVDNQAVVDPNNAIPEGDETNNSASTSTTVLAKVDLQVFNATSQSGLSSGSEGDWVFSVTNHGPDEVTNIVVETSLPIGVIPLNVMNDHMAWDCQTEENPINRVTCSGTKLASGDTVTVTVRVYVTAESGATIYSTSVVDPNNTIVETDENNNTAQGNATV